MLSLHLVTTHLAAALDAAGITGFEIREAEVETSLQFRELRPDCVLPPFLWLHVAGTSDDSDFYVTPDNRLAGSQKALDVILATNPSDFTYRDAC